jgi:hypothetical protein
MASIFFKVFSILIGGVLRDCYTLLGSKHLIKQLNKSPIMHTTRGEITNAIVKWVRDMCVTCLFEDHDVSLLSTKRVALRTNYSTEIAYHKHTIQTQSNNRKVFV